MIHVKVSTLHTLRVTLFYKNGRSANTTKIGENESLLDSDEIYP